MNKIKFSERDRRWNAHSNNNSMVTMELSDLPDIAQYAVKLGKWAWSRRFVAISLPWRMRLRRIQNAMSSPLLIDFLSQEYSRYQLLEIGRLRFPVVVFEPPRDTDLSNVSSLLKPLDLEWQPQQLTDNKGFYLLMRSVMESYEHQTFILKKLFTRPYLSLECGQAGFFMTLRSSYSLEWELLNAIATTPLDRNDALDRIKSKLPLRNRLQAYVSDPLTDGEGRATGVGISAMLAYEDQSGVKVLLRRRGRLSILSRKAMYHAFPSGMFQAPFREYDIEYSILHMILWEYYEEFFNVEDPTKKNIDPRWFYESDPVKELRSMLHSGAASLTLLGVCVDLLNLRPEILLLLYIQDKEWNARWTHRFSFNREVATASELSHNQYPVLRITADSSPDELFRKHGLDAGVIAPCTAAALKITLGHVFSHGK